MATTPDTAAGAAAPGLQGEPENDALRAAAADCRACPLGALATQTVWGEGPVQPRLMLVGEQPGDAEDREGRPFVGPAGRLLVDALDRLGLARDEVYLSNAVKHFKFEWRGRRRLHKTPGQREVQACHHWLEREIAAVKPLALVALGATAARALLGRTVAVTREHGQWQRRSDGRPVLVTWHPSALLRTRPPQRDAVHALWLEELRRAADGPA